jgi:hypothetical protein
MSRLPVLAPSRAAPAVAFARTKELHYVEAASQPIAPVPAGVVASVRLALGLDPETVIVAQHFDVVAQP